VTNSLPGLLQLPSNDGRSGLLRILSYLLEGRLGVEALLLIAVQLLSEPRIPGTSQQGAAQAFNLLVIVRSSGVCLVPLLEGMTYHGVLLIHFCQKSLQCLHVSLATLNTLAKLSLCRGETQDKLTVWAILIKVAHLL